MRLVVNVTPRFPIPPEMMPALIGAMTEWRAHYKDRMEVFEFYIGGGGFGIIECETADEALQFVMEFPFTPYSEVRVQPTVDGDAALGMYQAMLQQMAGGQ